MGVLKPLQGLQPQARNFLGTASCGASPWNLPAVEDAARGACQDQALGAYPDSNNTKESHALSAEIPPLRVAQPQRTTSVRPISPSVQHAKRECVRERVGVLSVRVLCPCVCGTH